MVGIAFVTSLVSWGATAALTKASGSPFVGLPGVLPALAFVSGGAVAATVGCSVW